ncbi:hypothetical protein [Micromonospora maritima]|uniref:hypothetical protein n=1 Tax=Micromonospora maritima TaxID=986711 RepID=UPI00157DEEC3|nr:hypothetical protein [Micromonospora maritima]
MSDPMVNANAYDLFESIISGLEYDEMRAHLQRATGEEPSEEDVEAVQDEWLAVRRYFARRRKHFEKQAQQRNA